MWYLFQPASAGICRIADVVIALRVAVVDPADVRPPEANSVGECHRPRDRKAVIWRGAAHRGRPLLWTWPSRRSQLKASGWS